MARNKYLRITKKKFGWLLSDLDEGQRGSPVPKIRFIDPA